MIMIMMMMMMMMMMMVCEIDAQLLQQKSTIPAPMMTGRRGRQPAGSEMQGQIRNVCQVHHPKSSSII